MSVVLLKSIHVVIGIRIPFNSVLQLSKKVLLQVVSISVQKFAFFNVFWIMYVMSVTKWQHQINVTVNFTWLEHVAVR
jgi:hypothetical protein